MYRLYGVFKFLKSFEEVVAAVFVGMGAAFQSVEFRVTRVGEERLGHGYGGGGITEVTEVSREPFVVVRVVVDLVGDEEMLGHVCVVNTCGGLLAKDGIVIALGL